MQSLHSNTFITTVISIITIIHDVHSVVNRSTKLAAIEGGILATDG